MAARYNTTQLIVTGHSPSDLGGINKGLLGGSKPSHYISFLFFKPSKIQIVHVNMGNSGRDEGLYH